MMMAATTYRIKTNNSNFYVVGALVIGFASLLKGWWDHYLSQTDKEYILNTKKNNNQRKKTSVQTYENVVNTLIFVMKKYFIVSVGPFLCIVLTYFF